jgi:ABC-type branched-subunit amino acid transport system substrate-binding protein
MTAQVAAAGDSLGGITAPSDGGTASGTTGLTAPGSTSGGGTTGGAASGGATTGGAGSTSGATRSTPITTNPGGTTGGSSGSTVRTPLQLGFVLTGTSNASQFGVSLGNTYSERQVDDAVVAAMNAQGGLGGRRIVPVYANTDTGSSNWDTDFAAACSTFTQDNKVAAVLGYAFTYSQSFERCLAAKKLPHLNTGFNVPGRSELAKYPLQTSLDVPTIDRRGLLKLIGAAADGVLTPKNKIGVITDNCPGTASSLSESFMPQAKKLGLTVAPPVTLNCANGSADAGGAVTALQNAELQFASSGVDRVIFHASSEGPALLLFSSSAESQSYHPQYVVSSLANLEALRSNFSAGQIANIHGYGWLPTQDVPPRFYPATNTLQKRCLSLLKSQSIVPASGPDFYYAYNVCEAVFVYEQALLRNGASTDGAAVSSAVRGLGTSFDSLTNQGGSLFGTDQPDAPRSMRHLVYTASCSCFAYTGPTRSIPTHVT